jgi:hypothetical protein
MSGSSDPPATPAAPTQGSTPPPPDDAADLRAAFAEREPTSPADGALSDETQDQIWRAAAGDLSGAPLSALLARVRSEPAVAEAWRVARAMQQEVPQDTPVDDHAIAAAPVVLRGPARWWRSAALATGIAAAAAAVLVVLPPESVDHSTPRGATDITLTAETPADVPLPRDAAILRWSGAPTGSTQSVTLTTRDLDPVASVGGLQVSEWTVPSDRLAPLAAGTALLWRVEVQLPDGGRVRSATFHATVE